MTLFGSARGNGAASAAGNGAASAAAQPFAHDGDGPRGEVGVLLCHGLTGTPQSLRPWADHLATAGYTVRLPLLPGHGTRWQDANRTTFADWLATVGESLAELRSRCRAVVVCGLSMGGTLTLRLAELHPDAISGIVLVNPSILSLRRDMKVLPLIKYFIPSLKGIASDIADPAVAEDGYDRTPLKATDSLRRAWAVVRADLGSIRLPVLLMHSAVDHVVEPENSRVLLASLGSADVTEVVLERSYHVATLDYDAPEIFARSVDFIERVTAGSTRPDDALAAGS
ncbi:MAG: alpha/beta fold hydrolase [Actinobacteria bacterium]|nr:alpha/beta fold hydrolase [Actinomycetota bacterium]